jgi:hypothetical protein
VAIVKTLLLGKKNMVFRSKLLFYYSSNYYLLDKNINKYTYFFFADIYYNTFPNKMYENPIKTIKENISFFLKI